MFANRFAVLALAGIFALTGCQEDSSPSAIDLEPELAMEGRAGLPTIADLASGTTLGTALELAGLTDTFDGDRHFTVFAPSEDAFAATFAFLDGASCPGYSSGALLADAALLGSILAFHVTRGDRRAKSVLSAGELRMLDGNWATISGGAIEGATISDVDAEARNGIVHQIEAVILPPAVAAALPDLCAA